ncbi:DtxR family iron (metal) dependent repressor [Salana multivorans]|uniref:Manganese transport regulator n=1 Tax=Salana multivorans TaxID=120377 RepID=A0A3N2D769_9MICO|nr:metal-dependent transcriptional regulator [Salana multivorans]ROR95595.1 DtxR family iron (metal) dependent repressor [Salana multivorans]
MAQDYLKAVWNAGEWSSQALTVKQLARRLGVTQGTASEGVRRLAESGYIAHERYGRVELTEAGRLAALAVVRRHRLVETLLVDTFGYAWDEVHEEAEILEHAISDELLRRIDAHLGHPTHDPHGDPIPSADGVITIPEARTLGELEAGECGVVSRVSDADPELLQRLAVGGVVPGRHVVVVDRDEASALAMLAASPHVDRVDGTDDAGADGDADADGTRATGAQGAAGTSVVPAGTKLQPYGLPALRAVWVTPG